MSKFTIHSKAPIPMNNYSLSTNQENKKEEGTFSILRKFTQLLRIEKKTLMLAIFVILINSLLSLAAPLIIGHTIDTYISFKDYHGLLVFSGILLVVYIGVLITSYLQTKLMGTVGQRVLFNLRNSVFNKLQELPIDFFNVNKSGDLISRINNDTDKLSQFLSQSLVQFVGSIFVMIGAGIFLLSINFDLGVATLIPALFIIIFTYVLSPWVKRKNTRNLQSVGNMSAEIQESIENFKTVVVFNRRDYFREHFEEANLDNYKSSITAGLVNNIFTPVYTLFSNIAQVIVLAFGIYLVIKGNFTLGLLVSFIAYVTNFYNPLRQIAAIWASFQIAMAGWDRISSILSLESNLPIVPEENLPIKSEFILEFKNVSFEYSVGQEVLHNINFRLEKGKTYALVGPTGGGKTTTASIIARLYDPTKGEVLLEGRNIKSYDPDERVQKIGFILQEPFLFSGTVKDNIICGNKQYENYTNEQLTGVLNESGLNNLIARFEFGLETKVLTTGEAISLGQKQLIAFIRAVLRKPDILILDEATANIDTVTEKILEEILEKLPASTTRIIIAHRLNTIENADKIFFVNSGEIKEAGSMQDAVNMLLHNKKNN